MAYAIDFITGAMTDLGVLAAEETASNEDAADVFTVLNMMADALGVERLTMYQIVRTVKTLTASTASYTIGTGGSINIVRPTWIDRAGIVIDNTASPPTEIPITVLTDQEYARWPQKALTNTQSQAVYYDHSWSAGLGLVYPLPIPTVSTTQLVLYAPSVAVAQFADQSTTDYTFPPGYARAIRKNLALEIAPMFKAEPSPLLMKQAEESKKAIKRANVRPVTLTIDPALSQSSGHWSINTDSYK